MMDYASIIHCTRQRATIDDALWTWSAFIFEGEKDDFDASQQWPLIPDDSERQDEPFSLQIND